MNVKKNNAKLQPEDHVGGGYMVDGAMVLLVAFGALVAVWGIVLYGSRFFGPKT